MRAIRTAIALIAIVVVRGNAQQTTLRDSAGIRILEVPGTGLASLPVWRIDGPALRIGDVSGDTNYEFNMAAFPWRLSDGRIVVANDQVELRFYDSTGKYLATVGCRGLGPGEYQQIFLWRTPRDSLLVTDARSGRVDVRNPDGQFVRSITIPRSAVPAWLPTRGALRSYSTKLDLNTPGVRKGAVVVQRILQDGRAADTVAILPGGWTEVLRGGAWRGARLSGSYMLASGAAGAVYVDGDYLAAYWFTPDGRLTSITRIGLPRDRVTNADIRADRQAQAAELARYRRLGVEGRSPAPAYAPFLPQALGVRMDAEGRAWIRRWRPATAEAAEWIVFAPGGLPVARVTMPAAFDPNDIGRDYVLGLVVDKEGVQSVHEYRIRR